jgi:AmmeMemoRadiSam system protein A
MIADPLSETEKSRLLQLARQAVEQAARGEELQPLEIGELPERLRAEGACFVTLTERGALRGCIGTLEAYQPLAQDVREHAVAAATEDWRFAPVRPQEVEHLRIEISRLTAPQPLAYTSPEELAQKLRPGVDGVVLRHRNDRATFLPQVWDKIRTPEEFLSSLCYKMGARRDLWRRERVDVFIYQVESFEEPE